MSVPPFAAAFVLSITTSYLCDRFHIRGLVCVVTSIIALVGFVIFLTSSSAKTQYGSLFLSIPGVYTSAPTLSTWNSTNSAPHVRRATAIAIGFMMTNAGGILSTWLLGSLSTAPRYVLGNAGDGSVQRWDGFGVCVVLMVFRVDEPEEEEDVRTGDSRDGWRFGSDVRVFIMMVCCFPSFVWRALIIPSSFRL